jgi:hypothetical protein
MESNNFAPIIVFAYKRVDHLKLCIDSLKLNYEAKYSDLIIYCDGPKNEEDLIFVNYVKEFVYSITGFKSVKHFFAKQNLGLSRSIIGGVTEQFRTYEKLIVLEDDLVTSKYFLNFMNSALAIYENSLNVSSIHGYTYPITKLPNTFFIRGADCWGWATWKRSWNDFEQNGTTLLKELRRNNLIYKFNLFGAYDYEKMLVNQINNKNDSWAVRWHASNFLQNRMALYPGISLVDNIGTDGSGTNFNSTDNSFRSKISSHSIFIEKVNVRESYYARNAFIWFFYKRKIKKAFDIILSRLYFKK